MRQVGSFDETAFNHNGSKKNKFFTSDHFMEEVSTPNPDKSKRSLSLRVLSS